MSKWIKNWRGQVLIFILYIWSRNKMNVNGSFNAGFVQYTLLTWYKCSVYFCKTEIVISIWQHFRSEERQTFKNVQNQFIFKNSLLTKYFWYKLVQFFCKIPLINIEVIKRQPWVSGKYHCSTYEWSHFLRHATATATPQIILDVHILDYN